VVSREHLFVGGSLYSEARRIATKVVRVVVETLHENGVDEVVVADSHGPMVNILVDEMLSYLKLVRGFPRPLSMLRELRGPIWRFFWSTMPRPEPVVQSLTTHTVALPSTALKSAEWRSVRPS